MCARELPQGLHTHPSVFAVENEYQIMVSLKTAGELLVSVRVGEQEYFYEVNGVRCSETRIHRIRVPMEALNAAKEYTVITRKMVERKEYFTETEEPNEYTYAFYPLEKETDIRIYHLADTHNYVAPAIKAAQVAGERPDILVFNGDIADGCGRYECLFKVHEIASGIAEGEIPCVYARGNHELRGKCAEQLANHMPTQDGYSYYTFRLGCIWGVVIDSGEDKEDSSNEYGHVVACHQFRVRETEFLKKLSGYDDPSVKYRLVISHNPFVRKCEGPFNVDADIFTEWAKILKETVKPQLMLSGHTHTCFVIRPGDPMDAKGTPCPVIVASMCKSLDGDVNGHVGATITLQPDRATVVCNDNLGTIGMQDTVLFE